MQDSPYVRDPISHICFGQHFFSQRSHLKTVAQATVEQESLYSEHLKTVAQATVEPGDDEESL